VFEGAYADSTEPLAHGVDISYHNHPTDDAGSYLPLDFEAIRASGFDFVILRAGSTPREVDGVAKGGLDPVFEMNYQAAKAAGLDVGVYFYTYATTKEDTLRDAALLLEWLDGKELEYPVYFDMEDACFDALSRRERTDLCLAFISALQERHYFTALYTSNNWLTNYLQTDKVTFLFDIWYARYPLGTGPYVWDTEKYGDHMGMWQYTQSGIISAVSSTTRFDFNYAYKDYPAIIRGLGYNGLGKD
jgi:GH25 family lysozyme M1 (1,4-beta-N-acetylmuramidase)